MNASDGRLSGEATGEIGSEDGVLVIKRIHVRYVLRVDDDADRANIERAFDTHAVHCPVYRSIHPQIACTTELELVPL